MDKTARIYVAGHTGLVGSALTSALNSKGYKNLILRTQSELDLTNQNIVNDFFSREKPEFVFLAAALVGGIVANNTYRADFIYQNLMIQSNVICASWKYSVKKLLFLGSTCIYPKNAPQPLKEEYLLTSPLEYTNEPYAVAKIAGLKMCEAFNIQYKTDFIAVMPTNLYGPGDNFNLERSHVLPALMRKIHLAKCLEAGDWKEIRNDLFKYPIEGINDDSPMNDILTIFEKYGIYSENLAKGSPKVTVRLWGTGIPLREFMYSEDMAEACVFIMETTNVCDIARINKERTNPDSSPVHFLNIGTGEEVSIKILAERIAKLSGFKGVIEFDNSKPDGTMRKATDISSLKHLGYTHKYDLNKGLAKAYSYYLGNKSA
jgi:GDP-L-fucose synthase